MTKNKTILGVDPSSTSIGLAKYKNGKYLYIDVWKRNEKKELSWNLVNYAEFLEVLFPVQTVVIEDLSVPLNLDTVKKISYFQGLTIYMAEKWKAEIILLRPSSARKAAYGKGNLKKEAVYDIVTEKHELKPFKKGGGDQSDAICLVEAYLNG